MSMPAARRFDSPQTREAAAMLCGTVTGSFQGLAVADLADDLVNRLTDRGETEPLTALEVALGAAAVISKLVTDVETVYGVPSTQTLARLGLWVATDELADLED